MDGEGRSIDRVLGVGGFLTAAAGLLLHITASANPEVAALDVVAALFGLVIIFLLITIAIRHRRAYPHGAGRAQLIAAWILTGLGVIWVLLVALDPSVEVETWSERLPSPADILNLSPLLLPIPLALASAGILKDAKGVRGALNEPRERPRR